MKNNMTKDRFGYKATCALSTLTQMALMSDSWPMKVCRHMLSLMSHSLTEASQAPDTKVRRSGDRDRLMTSPLWPEKTVVCWLVSMSHSALGQRAQSLAACQLRKACLHCTPAFRRLWLTTWCLLNLWWFDCHQWNGNMTGNLREQKVQVFGWVSVVELGETCIVKVICTFDVEWRY